MIPSQGHLYTCSSNGTERCWLLMVRHKTEYNCTIKYMDGFYSRREKSGTLTEQTWRKNRDVPEFLTAQPEFHKMQRLARPRKEAVGCQMFAL